jgi:uncharacterized protein
LGLRNALNMNYRGAKQFILTKLRTELSGQLLYHGLQHTMDVLRVATALCQSEGVNGRTAKLVKTAALFHDAGFVSGQHAGHEQVSCQIAAAQLPAFDYTPEDIDTICAMIMTTKIPQSPTTLLHEIICDADLDYLGRPDFYTIGRNLFHELQAYHLISDEQTWNRLQVSFLTAHNFHTKTNKTLREPIKQAYLKELQEIIKKY